jgi:hypothetical protein
LALVVVAAVLIRQNGAAGQAAPPPPRLFGHLAGSTQAVAVSGAHVYLGVGPRLVVLDVSAPARSRLAFSSPRARPTSGVGEAGSAAAISGHNGTDGRRSDPPVQRGRPHLGNRRGFSLCALRAGAVNHSRQWLKPQIAQVGEYDIPLRDELELESVTMGTPAASDRARR